MAKLVACQFVSTPDVEENLRQTEVFLRSIDVREDTLVVLPECFACFGAGDKRLLEIAETRGDGPIQSRISALAGKYGVWINAGTLPLKVADNDKFTASSLLINAEGQQVAEYQKIHLFDVQVDDNTGSYQESAHTQAGNQCVVVNDTPFGRIGLAVCYDVRFAGLFQAMGEIDVCLLPSAFTRRTGEAHWHPLNRARAIEKQCYWVAANQGGTHANGRQTYGHSCIISPWGEIIAETDVGPKAISANLDQQRLKDIRSAMPVSRHNQFRSHLV